jgi:hypothetical protein
MQKQIAKKDTSEDVFFPGGIQELRPQTKIANKQKTKNNGICFRRVFRNLY